MVYRLRPENVRVKLPDAQKPLRESVNVPVTSMSASPELVTLNVPFR